MSRARRLPSRVALVAFTAAALGGTQTPVAHAAPIGSWSNAATIDVGFSPNQFAASPDGSRLYVSTGSGVDIIDTGTNSAIVTIPISNGATGISVTPTGTAYAVSSSDGKVSVIDPATNTVTSTLTVEAGAVGMAAAGDAVYVTQPSSGSIAVIDSATNTVESTVPVGSFPILAAALGDSVYVSNAGSGTVSAIDTNSDTVTATIPVGGAPSGIAAAAGRVYVVEGRSASVVVIDAATNTVVDTIAVGGGTLTGVAVTGDGSTLFVNQSDTDTVAVINTTDPSARQSITVGARPGGAIASPSNTTAYVTNGEASSVSVLTTDAALCAGNGCIPSGPFGS